MSNRRCSFFYQAQRAKLAAKKQGAAGVKAAQNALNNARAQARLDSAAAKEAARQTKIHVAKQKRAADLQAAQWREEAKQAVAKAKAAMKVPRSLNASPLYEFVKNALEFVLTEIVSLDIEICSLPSDFN